MNIEIRVEQWDINLILNDNDKLLFLSLGYKTVLNIIQQTKGNSFNNNKYLSYDNQFL